MNKKKAFIWLLLAVIAVLVAVSFMQGHISAGEDYQSSVYATVFSLLPPVIAIVLALFTKEVYSSLFVGIITGGLLYSGFNLEFMLNTVFFNEDGGMIYKLADSWNVGILVFLVVLGILVALMNKAGGSVAFGEWASRHIKTKMGAQLATMALGVLIFVDDYFNCLTVGSVMRPVTDGHKISRAKLAYVIDATAAPICIIAPISSWAAAVTSSVPEDAGINGFATFLKTIPYNYYAILTLIMMIFIFINNMDYGPMTSHELLAETAAIAAEGRESEEKKKGKVIDLVFPVFVLIVACVIAMIYTGGFFEGVDFVTAFADSDASVGLVLGSFVALIFTFFLYMLRDVISFKEFMECVPEGFKAMISPILILTMAWTLSGMTNLLGAKIFVAQLVEQSAGAFQSFLPSIIFLVAAFLAFATGTSWGTFGILIPIVLGVFPSGDMMVISIAACLAGSVCGDHCSPISDTTIMASAGAGCNHVDHVVTQLPYALTVAAVSFVSYVITGFVRNAMIGLVVAVVLLIATLVVIKQVTQKKEAK